jgi:hypothetical protein
MLIMCRPYSVPGGSGGHNNMEMGSFYEHCLSMILTMLDLGQRYDPLVTQDTLKVALQSFILGNKYMLG